MIGHFGLRLKLGFSHNTEKPKNKNKTVHSLENPRNAPKQSHKEENNRILIAH